MKYLITIENNDGLKVSGLVDAQFASNVMQQIIMEGKSAPESASLNSEITTGVAAKVDSVRLRDGVQRDDFQQFLTEHNAKRACDQLVCAAYLWEGKGKKQFSANEYNEFRLELGLGSSKNTSRDLRWAVRTKWLVENDGRYELTSAGRQVIRDKFPRSVVKATAMSKFE
ncbi:hypothetical protein [Vibrio alfacsensis]|uniref:hypothetical protein n=1 Tax=Vibrio alfacsensis TaxID=1074311 RepID=UPI00406765B7